MGNLLLGLGVLIIMPIPEGSSVVVVVVDGSNTGEGAALGTVLGMLGDVIGILVVVASLFNGCCWSDVFK